MLVDKIIHWFSLYGGGIFTSILVFLKYSERIWTILEKLGWDKSIILKINKLPIVKKIYDKLIKEVK